LTRTNSVQFSRANSCVRWSKDTSSKDRLSIPNPEQWDANRSLFQPPEVVAVVIAR